MRSAAASTSRAAHPDSHAAGRQSGACENDIGGEAALDAARVGVEGAGAVGLEVAPERRRGRSASEQDRLVASFSEVARPPGSLRYFGSPVP